MDGDDNTGKENGFFPPTAASLKDSKSTLLPFGIQSEMLK